MKKVEYICDIDGCENKVEENKERKMQVIEKTSTSMMAIDYTYYLRDTELDVCSQCIMKIYNSGKYIINDHTKGADHYEIGYNKKHSK